MNAKVREAYSLRMQKADRECKRKILNTEVMQLTFYEGESPKANAETTY